MRALDIVRAGEKLSVLCLGAHADDIEIGAGGTLLTWLGAGAELDVHWCVAAAGAAREAEARASAEAFMAGAARATVEVGGFRDSYLPYEGGAVKQWVEAQKPRMRPDIVLTHCADDAHQDHRLLSELAWNAFRSSLILEYEIPKWDGDLGRPNFYVPLAPDVLERKIALLDAHFGTQRSKDWFDAETFRGLARLRGVECRARYAEGFRARKIVAGIVG
ncbi:MAG: PIG-L family deacetylase [Hyphomonadaceae bacterium]|nr:PIG-L family deacetylase [Hyphomonadaceae bacterium]GIK47596.1 MAG: GlcNAc-PI de-N-acetylase [Alphaproteobacteria bacterium]